MNSEFTACVVDAEKLFTIFTLCFLNGFPITSMFNVSKRFKEFVYTACTSLKRVDPSIDLFNTNLAWIIKLSNLKVLKISGPDNIITDLSPIASLKNLSELYIGGCRGIADLKPIGQCINLSILNMCGLIKVKNLESFRGLHFLNTLIISQSGVNNIDALPSFPALHTLYMNDMFHVSDFKGLSGCIALKKLSINDSRVSDLHPLSTLKKLEWLNMQNNKNQKTLDMTPLFCLTRLVYIDLRGDRAVDLEPILSNMPQTEVEINQKIFAPRRS